MIKFTLQTPDGVTVTPELPAEPHSLVTRHANHGWLRLPAEAHAFLPRITETAMRISAQSEVHIVLGIGGSYLGARAVIDAVHPRIGTQVVFAGNSLSGQYLERVVRSLEGRDFSVSVISKSGTTLETAAALRVFADLLKLRYGADWRGHLYIIAGAQKNALRTYAESNGVTLFDIPEDVGGRYSVLTAVGLLPCAVAGVDVDALMAGALEEAEHGTDAIAYAAARQALYAAGYRTEVLATFEPDARYLGEWWKQLYGESEGKAHGGIFPATADYTADLHSLGQYMQEGARDLMETFVTFGSRSRINIPASGLFSDGLASAAGRRFDELNALATQAVKTAHLAGGVPVMTLDAPWSEPQTKTSGEPKPHKSRDEREAEFMANPPTNIAPHTVGALLYFFEYACAVSAGILGVNPFDQPGVEAYKSELKALIRGL
ncbi:MAG: glucose-6-phosphate isomerase [Oscillospiraceae bacterium]|jgi:glucose-6-phosphate isomerase|nr:glucose-6-phosphate isomerase [Oscillospiraceae bacterium]